MDTPRSDTNSLTDYIELANGNCCGCSWPDIVIDEVIQMEQIIKTIVRVNDTDDGAIGDVRDLLSEDHAKVLIRILKNG